MSAPVAALQLQWTGVARVYLRGSTPRRLLPANRGPSHHATPFFEGLMLFL